MEGREGARARAKTAKASINENTLRLWYSGRRKAGIVESLDEFATWKGTTRRVECEAVAAFDRSAVAAQNLAAFLPVTYSILYDKPSAK